MKYVAVAQQGMVIDQRVIAQGDDEGQVENDAGVALTELNSQTGMTNSYTVNILDVPDE